MKMRKLGEVCRFIGGGTPSKKNKGYYSGSIPWASVRDMNTRLLSSTEFHITDAAVRESATNVIPGGEVIISTHVGLGKVCVLAQDTAINQDLKAVVPKTDDIDRWYLYHWFVSQAHRLVSAGNGATVKGVTLQFVANLEIPVPDIATQERIAASLTRICELKRNVEVRLERLRMLVQSQYVAMFGTMDESRYELRPLGELCEFIKDGTHQTPIYTEDKTAGYKFLSSKDVATGSIDWANVKFIPKQLHEELQRHISPKKNDILLAKNGTTGIAALVETDEVFDIYVSLALLRFKPGVDVRYILYAINSPETKRQFDRSLKGVGVPNLHLGEIRKTLVPLPPIPIQQQFADFTTKIDRLRLIAEEMKRQLDLLYRAKLQEYFG